MKLGIVLTMTIVSLFVPASSSPNRDSTLVDKILRADALRVVHASGDSRRSGDDHLEIKATDLLRSVLRIVQSYSDEDFEELLKAVQEKIERIDNPDKKVIELKRGILQKIKDVQGVDGRVVAVKGDLGDVLMRLQDSKYDGRALKLDSAEKRDSALKLLTTLNDLDSYRFKSKRTDISLSDVVRGGLEALASLLAAPAPRKHGTSTTPSTSRVPPTRAPRAEAALREGAPGPALGELVLLSLLSLPSLSNVRLQLVKEKEVEEPSK